MNWYDYMQHIIWPLAALLVWLWMVLVANWSKIREAAHRYLSQILTRLGLRRYSKPPKTKRGQGKVRRRPRGP